MAKIKLLDGKVIEMREPKVKDVKMVNHIKDDFEKEIALLSNLTEMTPEEIEKLSMKDYTRLDEELQGFLS